jgi:hypothetical protein
VLAVFLTDLAVAVVEPVDRAGVVVLRKVLAVLVAQQR